MASRELIFTPRDDYRSGKKRKQQKQQKPIYHPTHEYRKYTRAELWDMWDHVSTLMSDSYTRSDFYTNEYKTSGNIDDDIQADLCWRVASVYGRIRQEIDFVLNNGAVGACRVPYRDQR